MARKKSSVQLSREIAEILGEKSRPRAGAWRGSDVQSLLFARPRWTASTAKAWARKHGYRHGKVHVTDNYVRLRQSTPVSGAEKRTITFGDGIRAVIEQA